MKRYLLYIALAALPLLTADPARAAAILTQIGRTDEPTRTQLFLRFSALPEHSTETNGRRVDIILQDTIADRGLVAPAADERLVRTVVRSEEQRLILSFYFRYAPQKVTTAGNLDSSSLMLDIAVGNPVTAIYPDLATGLQGVTVLNRDSVDYTNPVQLSNYAGNWRSFFQLYEGPVSITPPMRLDLPSFPLARWLPPAETTPQWLSAEQLQESAEGKWAALQLDLRRRIETEPDEELRKRLLLTYAETLVRAGDFEEPFRLLQEIRLSYPDTLLAQLASLLFIALQAGHDDPYLAQTELTELIASLGTGNPFLPNTKLLQAELAMMTGQLDKAAAVLSDDSIAYTGETFHLRLMRQADLFYLQGERIKALVSYLQLQEKSDVIATHPRSLANFSDVLYIHNRPEDAMREYERLSNLLTDRPQQDLAMFRLAASRLKAGMETRQVLPLINQVQNAFPASEGAWLATMKEIDLGWLAGALSAAGAEAEYAALAEKAGTLAIRAEARLKEAILLSIEQRGRESIEKSMQFLREFQNSPLRVEAKALIIKQLPMVLKKLVEQEQYIDALVLAKQNRELFARGWLEIALLYDLANAYEALGFYDRAARTYEYMFDLVDGEEREQLYASLVEALYRNGQFDQAEDYCDRFFFRYPESTLQNRMYLLRIKSLMAAGRTKQLTTLLDKPERPNDPEIDLVAAQAYYLQDSWAKVIGLLDRPVMASLLEAPENSYLLAESLFQENEFARAAPLFTRLVEQGYQVDQARYRLAEIAFAGGDDETALKQLSRIAEEGKEQMWIKMAKESIKLYELKQR